MSSTVQLPGFTLLFFLLPLQFHLAVGSGAQQYGDAFLRSHRRQLRPGVPLSVRRLTDHRLLLQPRGGRDALLPVIPSHGRHWHGGRAGHGARFTLRKVQSWSLITCKTLFPADI